MRRCPQCGFRLSARHTRVKTKQTYRRGEHEYLVGVLAHTKRRLEVFRNAGGEADWFDEDDPSTVQEIQPAICQGCVEPHLIGWEDGEWHHNVKHKKKNKGLKVTSCEQVEWVDLALVTGKLGESYYFERGREAGQ